MHSRFVQFVAIAAMISASSAQSEGLKKVGEISIPGETITDIGIMAIDQASGLGYLADKTNKGVVVFDTNTNKFVTRISGFVGRLKDGDASGPNGVVIVKDGAEVWVSDGDSTIKVIDIKTNTVIRTLNTGGKKRANGMALGGTVNTVIVANSNDAPPYLTFISTEAGNKIVGKVMIPESAENLERSAYHASSGMFYTAIPVSTADENKGLLAQTDPKSAKMIKLHELHCHPHSLSIVSDTTIFLGCSSAHGSNKKSGGDMAIFDIPSAKVVGALKDYGGNGGSTANLGAGQYYHSTSGGILMVVDTKTKQGVQQIQTSRGARSAAVHQATGRLYVAVSDKSQPCPGCITIYARH